MKSWYITFGQDHIHFIRGHRIDKDCIVLIRAEDYDEMRKKAFAYFGNSFYTDYEMEKFNSRGDKRFFPRGVIDLENTTGNYFKATKIKFRLE